MVSRVVRARRQLPKAIVADNYPQLNFYFRDSITQTAFPRCFEIKFPGL